jgi:acyl-CoA synthetase (NDP forming)
MTLANPTWTPSNDDSGSLLTRFGIAIPRETHATTLDEVHAQAATFSTPLVLKAIAPNLVHKSDVGGVVVGIANPDECREHAQRMKQQIPGIEGYLLQEQITGSHELFIGLRRDQVLGPFVLCGLGGIWVESLDDVAVRPVPCSKPDALEMLMSLRAASIFDGARGTSPVDRDAISEFILAVSHLGAAHPEIEQLDLNPVVVADGRVVALDRHIVCTSQTTVRARGERSGRIGSLLKPKSIAVIGASQDTTKVGGRLYRYLMNHGFPRPVFPVNARAEPVMGEAAFASVADLPETPDLACVVVPLASVLPVVRECVDAGIPAVTIYSSGFAETGPEGQLLQAELLRLASENDVAIAGPNTAGMINAHESMCASITMAFEGDEMPAGNIGLVTQSGGLGSALVSRLWERGAGVSSWVSCGNEVDVALADYFEYLVDDDETSVVVLFIEALREIERFNEISRRALTRGKPVLAFKTGTTNLGRAAVLSHTAALAGDDRLYEAMFQSLGVVRTHDLEALLDAAIALSWQPLPRGNRVAVVSTSGGACSIAADACDRAGLDLPSFSEATRDAVRAVIPPFGASGNPVDVTLGASTHPNLVGDVVAAIKDDPDIDAVLVVLSSNVREPALQMARHLGQLQESLSKPIVVARVAADSLASAALAHYRTNRIPVYPTPERAVSALAALVSASHGIRQARVER